MPNGSVNYYSIGVAASPTPGALASVITRVQVDTSLCTRINLTSLVEQRRTATFDAYQLISNLLPFNWPGDTAAPRGILATLELR
jgi:hypothetical protein